MNQRNVKALADLLVDLLDFSQHSRAYVESAAVHLAHKGVLVPRVIDDDTLASILSRSDDGRGGCFPGVLRDCLERVAKGEELPPKGYRRPSPEEIREIVERVNPAQPGG